LDFTWDTHHSMVIENVCDFAHAFLHRKYRPFTDAKLTHYESDDNRVFLKYDTFVAGGRFSGIFIDRQRVNTRAMELCYEYPYQWSNTGDKIRHWCFFLPINENKTRVFFLFYFDALKIPMTQVKMPRLLQEAVLNMAKPLLFAPLLRQDGMALEAEMQAYNQHWDAPPVELNPIIPLFQKLTASHWENYLVRSGKLQPVPAE
ncbi:MAG: aromatic ring-hydroxylating dioxygenase subunit alpha, partial [Candidatus Methylumidiphilus sp.]